MRATLSFHVTRDNDVGTGITPVIDERPLTEMITDFESGHGYQPAGGYSGLVPTAQRLGDLARYYLGQENGQWPAPGSAWLLGCDCGDPGCWPLSAQILVEADTVTWTDFAQPHRQERDYNEFGPFVFEREQYENAVRRAVAELES